MAEFQLPKLAVRVRFPSPAPKKTGMCEYIKACACFYVKMIHGMILEGKMSKFEKVVKGSFYDISEKLHNDISNSAVSINLVDESRKEVNGCEMLVRVYDKYFMRNSSRASLTVVMISNKDNDEIYVSAIGSGGGTGVFLRLDWGAENNLVYLIEDSLANMGY